MLEKTIEQALCKRVKELGGSCDKYSSPSRRAVPDRIVMLPNKTLIFVECKAPGKAPTDAQYRDHERRRAMGFDVRVISTLEQVNAFPN
jgi:hypothetical protein